MKKTTTQYFCDLCKEEIKEVPSMHHVTNERSTFGGDCFCSCVDVDFTLKMYGDENSKENILCNRCKLEALKELTKILEKGLS